MFKLNQGTWYTSQHTWCLFQARINREGCDRKGIRYKNGRDDEDGGTNLDGWHTARLLMHLPLLSSPCTTKPRRWCAKYDCWFSPSGRLCLCKQEVGKPSQNAADICAKAEGCVHEHLKADKLRKGWGFRVSTWNVDSMTGRAGELIQILADREVDGECIQETHGEVVAAGSLELKTKDISYSGWEMRRDLI